MKSFFTVLIAFITALTTVMSGGELADELNNKGTILGYSETHAVQKELPDLYADENGDFTVLQVSDTHFTTGITFCDLSLMNKIKNLVSKYDPDLVFISGDMIDDGNDGKFNKAYVLRMVAEFFEEADQYWTYVPGNNDNRNYGTSEDITAYLLQYEHCLISDVPEISGGAQYSVDIVDESKTAHSLIFLDSMDYDNDDPDHKYGYIHEDQVNWCKEEIESKKTENEDITVSIMMHENTPNFDNAAKDGEAYKFGFPEVLPVVKSNRIPKNKPLDDMLTASGCTGLVTIGHVHPATAQCSFYEGTYYHVAPQAIVASTLITIHTREDNTKDMYDFDSLYY